MAQNKEKVVIVGGGIAGLSAGIYALLSGFATEHGYKNGYVLWPVRTAVSGKQMTPGGATELMEILGKEESIKRIKAAIEKLS